MGHGPTLFAVLSKCVDLRRVRLDFGSRGGAVRAEKVPIVLVSQKLRTPFDNAQAGNNLPRRVKVKPLISRRLGAREWTSTVKRRSAGESIPLPVLGHVLQDIIIRLRTCRCKTQTTSKTTTVETEKGDNLLKKWSHPPGLNRRPADYE